MFQGVFMTFTKYGLSCGWSTIHLMMFKIWEQKLVTHRGKYTNKINTTYHRHKHVLSLYYHYPQLTMIDKQNRLNDIKNTNMLLHTDTKPSFTHPNSHTHLMRASHQYKVW